MWISKLAFQSVPDRGSDQSGEHLVTTLANKLLMQPSVPGSHSGSEDPKCSPCPQLGSQTPTPQDHLNIEVLRVDAQQKLQHTKHLLSFNNDSLKHFLDSYQPYPSLNLNMQQLRDTNKAKIIKRNSSIFYGEVTGNQMDGRGVLMHGDGKVFEGHFQQGEKFGQGYEIYPSGNLYFGHFQRNHKHGQGMYFWFEASIKVIEGCCSTEYYTGEWWGGMPSGKGVHHRITGDLYEGDFKNGLKHGSGFERFPNGDTYRGGYVNGLSEGFGEYEWRDGSQYKGDFKQGLRHGFGIWKDQPNGEGEYYKGHYLFDRKSGYGVYVWGSDQFYKGEFFQDKRHGFGELFIKSKVVYEGAWENGEQNPEIKHRQRPVTKVLPSRLQQAKFLTEGDIPINNPKRPVTKAKQPLHNSLVSDIRSPKILRTIKRPLPRLVSNPQVDKLQRNSYFSKLGHRNCIPIDEYLTMKNGGVARKGR